MSAYNLQTPRFNIQDQKLNESSPDLATVNATYIPVLIKATKNYPDDVGLLSVC